MPEVIGVRTNTIDMEIQKEEGSEVKANIRDQINELLNLHNFVCSCLDIDRKKKKLLELTKKSLRLY